MIQTLGQNAILAKTDLKSAFRLLPIYPGDFDLLGIKCMTSFTLTSVCLLVPNYLVPYSIGLAHSYIG